ncbi:MAG: DUF1992 domain-containing protein [Candidatus Promineifilaceae bacterium]
MSTESPSKQTPEESKRKRNHVLTAASYKTVVEKQIQEAMERGEFDNLPGKGKPLDLDINHYAGDNELAFKMLKDNNFTLPWIADRNRLFEDISDFRERMLYQWQLHGVQVLAMLRGGQEHVAQRRWTALLMQWQAGIDRLNKRIGDVNMGIPVRNLEILSLGIDSELTRIGVKRELADNLGE